MKKAIVALIAAGRTAAGWTPDALIVAGVLAISNGAREMYSPAGWIVLGAFALAGGVLLAKGGK